MIVGKLAPGAEDGVAAAQPGRARQMRRVGEGGSGNTEESRQKAHARGQS